MQFGDLYKRYSRMVFNLALHYVQNREDAEEITQDTFVSIYHSLHTFQDQSQISTWIYRIGINKCLDFIKSRSRKKRFALFYSLFQQDTAALKSNEGHFDHPGVILEQKESLEKLFSLINELPSRQKTVLILSKLEHKSQKEIARILNMSPKAVESLVQRAKVHLKNKIDQSEGSI